MPDTNLDLLTLHRLATEARDATAAAAPLRAERVSPEWIAAMGRMGRANAALEDAFTPDVVLSLLARLQEAETRIKEATTPDICGVEEDVEYAETGFEGLLERIPSGLTMRVWANKSLGDNWWAAHIVDGDERSRIALYPTEAEARAAISAAPLAEPAPHA